MAAAITLLRTLPRQRGDVPAARASFERFQSAHPGVRADLLVDHPPGSPRVDYDILFEHPAGGSLALCWRQDEGVPWSVEYADHWAANFVVTVNDRAVTIQDAVLYLRLESRRSPDLMADIVDQQLVAEAIEADPPPVSPEEHQDAADAFRAVHDLLRADATHRWLAETGLTVERFHALTRWLAQRRKLEDRIAAGRVEAHFAADPARYETVHFFRVNAPDGAAAHRLAAVSAERGLWAALQSGELAQPDTEPLEGALHSRYSHELEPELASAPVGALVGPAADGPRHWIAHVLARRPARLDARTRAAIRTGLFRQWLAERRKTAVVRWHWL